MRATDPTGTQALLEELAQARTLIALLDAANSAKAERISELEVECARLQVRSARLARVGLQTRRAARREQAHG